MPHITHFFTVVTYNGIKRIYKFYSQESAETCHKKLMTFAGEIGIKELGPVTAY